MKMKEPIGRAMKAREKMAKEASIAEVGSVFGKKNRGKTSTDARA